MNRGRFGAGFVISLRRPANPAIPSARRCRLPDCPLPVAPAMAARPQRTVQYQQRVSATRTIAVTRTVYADGTLADALHYAGVLGDRQHMAACRLYGLHLAAGLLPRLTPRVDVVHDEVEDETEAAEGIPEGEARWVYRQLLREVGPVYGPALDALMLGRHGGIGRYTVIQDALDALADRWGMETAGLV